MSCLKPSPPGCGNYNECPDKFGCSNECPDFQIKRHDTRPAFKVAVEDDNGPLDLTGLVLEANMWVNSKLKANIDDDDTTIKLSENIGFDQILPGDIIIMDRVRSPEQMSVISFDEIEKTIEVGRGHNGTTASAWKKGNKLRAFRLLNAAATTEMLYDDITQIDGTVLEDQLIESYLVYEWTANDTCVPGCFWLEFKLIKISEDVEIPSVTPVCYSGDGVEWVRRFPSNGEFLIKVWDSPTSEV